MAEIFRGEVDGVPVFWSETGGPYRAGLLFRVGQADETLPTRGIGHLVEHLALFDLGRQFYSYNGRIDRTTTIFYAEGGEEEVLGFLERVGDGLRNPPLERLGLEKRVLRAEGEGWGGYYDHLREMRFGRAGYGLVNAPEYGLRGAGAVEDWLGRYFTRGNAAIWMSGPPLKTLELKLREGVRREPPRPDPLPGLGLPQERRWGSGGSP